MREKIRFWRFGAVGVLMLLTSFSLSGGRAAAAPLTLTEPFAPDECLQCSDDMSYCDPGTHDAWDNYPASGEFWTRNGGAHSPGDCRTGSCWTKHGPFCIPTLFTPSDYESIRVAVLRNDAASLAKLVESHSASVLLNNERSAVQLMDCKGSVYLHLPASSALLREATRLSEERSAPKG